MRAYLKRGRDHQWAGISLVYHHVDIPYLLVASNLAILYGCGIVI